MNHESHPVTVPGLLVRRQLHEEFQHLRSSWWWFLLLGILLAVCGTAALVFPGLTIVTSFAAVVILGVSLMVAGLATIIASFWAGKWSGLLVQLLVGILYLVAGFAIAETPGRSAAMLTLFLASMFIVVGAFRNPAGEFTLANVVNLFTPSILAAFWISIRISFASAFLGCLIGFAVAWAVVLGELPRWLRGPVLTFSGVASNFAGVPLAFAFLATLGRVGLVTILLREWLGINIYAPHNYVRAAPDTPSGFALAPITAGFPHMQTPWLKVGPEALHWGPRHVARLWDVKDIYITENGCAGTDTPAADGIVYDTDRVMFVRNYLTQLQRATAAGVPVRGYFLWSLLDNFEWADGYETRFGLHYVDYKTLKRTPIPLRSFVFVIPSRSNARSAACSTFPQKNGATDTRISPEVHFSASRRASSIRWVSSSLMSCPRVITCASSP